MFAIVIDVDRPGWEFMCERVFATHEDAQAYVKEWMSERSHKIVPFDI